MIDVELKARLRGIYHAVFSHDPHLHKNEGYAPFFIVGSGRCGTTLLRRVLQASPDLHIPPENWAMGGCISDFRYYSWLMPWKAIVNLYLGRHIGANHRWFANPPSNLQRRLLSIAEPKRSLARLIAECYIYHGESQEAQFTRWADKTPLNINHMDAILEVFPDARFIHMIRDGIDVVHSWSKLGKYKGDVTGPAKRWKDAIAKGEAFSHSNPESILEVRYERFVRNPADVAKKIFRFIDLEYDEDMLTREDHFCKMGQARKIEHYQKAFQDISPRNIGKGREALTSQQAEKLKPMMNDVLTDLGYDPIQQ